MKKLFIAIALLLCYLSGYTQKFNYLPKHDKSQIINHKHYTLSYSEKDEQAQWVAYLLCSSKLNAVVSRMDHFRADPMVPTGSASLKDYRGSGYDRGHLAPAADMAFDETAMSESFYLSNMSPQKPGFNRGIWKNLESKVREWAAIHDTLYIISGGILQDGLERIGGNQVSIPNYYYKIILDYDPYQPRAIAFIMPNEKTDKNLVSFCASIDEVEYLTRIDFFPALPDSIENSLESGLNPRGWFFGELDLAERSFEIEGKTPDKEQGASEKININIASLEELMTLQGIGMVKAKAIMDARPFHKIDELLKIKGIGKKSLEKIAEKIELK